MMKFFTQELLTRYRSSNRAIADTAAIEWDKASDAYVARLKQIRSHLPVGVRRLLNHATLHDAGLVTLNTSVDGAEKKLFLTFQLEGTPEKAGGGIELGYRLSGPALVRLDKRIKRDGEDQIYVLYDEFDLKRGREKEFTHSILMTGGIEFSIPFFSVAVKRFGRILSSDKLGPAIEAEWQDDDQFAFA